MVEDTLESGMTLKISKCNFFYSKIEYLRYKVSTEGVRPSTLKTDDISKFPTPGNVRK